MKPRMKRYAVGAVALGLAIYGVFGSGELLDLLRAQKERDTVLDEIKRIEADNSGLDEKVRLLKTDRRYIAHVARVELGMIGKDEIVYRVKTPGGDAGQKPAR
ncbi:MAG: septum formation initiator family protein [Deltaproteobacteria bacterium]|nr:septum formation initiator family protein [Deltaproteobacteria bacterium]